MQHEPTSQSRPPLISLYNELRLLLLAGVVIFSAGVGGLVYESRGNIAHISAAAAVGIISLLCFLYASKRKSPFSFARVEEKEPWFHFSVLLGALTLATTIAYLQFRFNFFGEKYGLATFIPMVLLFIAAYYYDHKGVLGMAITALAAWAGIVAAPRAFGLIQWEMNRQLVSTGIALSILLELIAIVSKSKSIKAHFTTVYHWSALHLGFIAILTGLFNLNIPVFTGLMVLCGIYFYRCAVKNRSFAELLVVLLYLYGGCAYLFIRLLSESNFTGMAPFYIGIFYFLFTSAAVAFFLIHRHKKNSKDDRI